MRFIDLTCPSCGATLRINEKLRELSEPSKDISTVSVSKRNERYGKKQKIRNFFLALIGVISCIILSIYGSYASEHKNHTKAFEKGKEVFENEYRKNFERQVRKSIVKIGLE